MESAEVSGTPYVNLVIFCDPCQIDSGKVTAVCYCGDCKEYYCKTCSQVHQKLAATRDHAVKEKNDLPKMRPLEETRIVLPETCLVHTDRFIDYFCCLHEELCCSLCLSKSHNNCDTVKNIPEYLETVDMAKELSNLKCNMQGLADDVNDTMSLVQISLKAIELNHEVATSKMQELKTSVIAHVDELHGTLSEEMDGLMEKDFNKIQPYKKKCDAISFDLGAVDSYLNGSIKNNKRQLFLAVKKAEVKVSSNRADLQEIMHSNDLDVTRYSFNANSELTELKESLYSFGTLDVKDGASKSVRLDKTLYVKETDEENSCCITGLAILSKSSLVVADHKNETVKLIDIEDDRILSKIKLESAPWDVTAISDKQIAVTAPDKETVYILCVTGESTLQNLPDKEIIVNRKCYGIVFTRDKIFITTCEPSKLEAYNTSGKLLSSVELDISNPEYISVNHAKSKIYVSDNTEGRYIKELDIDDFSETDTLSSCKDEVIGMASDKTGVLYYCDSYAHVIDTVCIEGRHVRDKEYKELITEFSNYPKSVSFNDETNRLFVGMDGDELLYCLNTFIMMITEMI